MAAPRRACSFQEASWRVIEVIVATYSAIMWTIMIDSSSGSVAAHGAGATSSDNLVRLICLPVVTAGGGGVGGLHLNHIDSPTCTREAYQSDGAR